MSRRSRCPVDAGGFGREWCLKTRNVRKKWIGLVRPTCARCVRGPGSDNQRVCQYYEGFHRDSRWTRDPPPGYLDQTIADLRQLGPALQAEAIVVDQFEVRWPQHLLADAINGLADLGRSIRYLFHADRMGGRQVANAMEDDIEITRRRMLDGVQSGARQHSRLRRLGRH